MNKDEQPAGPAGSPQGDVIRFWIAVVLFAALIGGGVYRLTTGGSADASDSAPKARSASVKSSPADQEFCGAVNLAFTAASVDVPDAVYDGCVASTRGGMVTARWRRMREVCDRTSGAFLLKCVQRQGL